MTEDPWPAADETEPTPIYDGVLTKENDVPLLTPDEDATFDEAVGPKNVWEGRHPSVAHFEEMFAYDHLATGRLKEVSKRCADLAETMVGDLPDGPELTAGLRALWEAKNCFVIQAARFSGVDHEKNKPGA